MEEERMRAKQEQRREENGTEDMNVQKREVGDRGQGPCPRGQDTKEIQTQQNKQNRIGAPTGKQEPRCPT